ncbi:MAG: RNA-binding transcriptional accessory protein [Clostridia bacterium]|nr:RNA-binding transcriptional accessory protein [Clostridia bacterium]
MDIIKILSEELNIPAERVEKTVALIDEGNTITFIARYRKEVTGSLDDVTLRALDDRLSYLRKLDERREEIRTAIENQGKLTDELTHALSLAVTLVELEDIYRPYKQKRRTRASVARERGLAPLAELILSQPASLDRPIEETAAEYVDAEKDVPDAAAALAGASDIIAEDISDSAEYRKMLRDFAFEAAELETRLADEEKENTKIYADYAEYREPVRTVKGHRVLAITRGEKEECLKVTMTLDRDAALARLYSRVITEKDSPTAALVRAAAEDSYDRLIFPSLEREVRAELFDTASEGALKVFSDNLRHLLLAAPLKGKTVLGYDPGYRTGCKLAVVDKTGKVLDTAVIYPTKPREETDKSRRLVLKLINTYGIDVVAIGNGTASRESEAFIAETLKSCDRKVAYTIVSEAGASVYSASELAAKEFPDFDVTERSAVSIARRLQDPLAELVKIDPKAIGVGQYQHDMKQNRLTEALDGVVEDCVNSVGVDVNTASYSLLSHIAGINATAAKNIVAYREENGEFRSRSAIKKVPKIGDKAFQQCAGFLRVSGSSEVLDNTGVHPESYAVARALLAEFGMTEDEVRGGRIGSLRALALARGTGKLAKKLECGEPTLLDIIGELEKPGRDIRDSAPPPVLRTDVLTIDDLEDGMVLTGTVRNVVDFGAFVDIGVHDDGLLHVSEMSDRFVKNPADVLKVGDVIEVRIKGVDRKRGRISLTRKTPRS